MEVGPNVVGLKFLDVWESSRWELFRLTGPSINKIGRQFESISS